MQVQPKQDLPKMQKGSEELEKRKDDAEKVHLGSPGPVRRVIRCLDQNYSISHLIPGYIMLYLGGGFKHVLFSIFFHHIYGIIMDNHG